jgi:hypothetical protein
MSSKYNMFPRLAFVSTNKFEDPQALRLQKQLEQIEKLQAELVEVKSAKAKASAKANALTAALMLLVVAQMLLPISGMICSYQGVPAGEPQKR